MSDQDRLEIRQRRRIRFSIRALMVFVLIAGCLTALYVQRVRLKDAEADCQQATLVREVTEIALIEYSEGVFKADLESLEGEISLATADLKRAEERADKTKRSAETGKAVEAAPGANGQEVMRAKARLKEAETKGVTLEATKARTIEDLTREIEKAKAVERDKRAIYTELKGRWMSRLVW